MMPFFSLIFFFFFVVVFVVVIVVLLFRFLCSLFSSSRTHTHFHFLCSIFNALNVLLFFLPSQVISVNRTAVVGPALLPGSVCVGTPTHVHVHVRNDDGEALVDITEDILTADVLQDELTSTTPALKVTRVAPGVLRVEFTPRVSGAHRLALSVHGAPLAGSPWCIGVQGEQDRSVRLM